jgi:hypothetical protein
MESCLFDYKHAINIHPINGNAIDQTGTLNAMLTFSANI